MKSDPGRKTHRLNSEVYVKDSVEWREGNAKRNFQKYLYNNNKKRTLGVRHPLNIVRGVLVSSSPDIANNLGSWGCSMGIGNK